MPTTPLEVRIAFVVIAAGAPKAGHLSGHPGGGEAVSTHALSVRHELAPALRGAEPVSAGFSGVWRRLV
jgi:hypothetical protein